MTNADDLVEQKLREMVRQTYSTGNPRPFEVDKYGRAIIACEHLEEIAISYIGLRSLLAAAEARNADLVKALRSIAESNLGDANWQANYNTIKQVARNAIPEALRSQSSGDGK